VLEVVGRKRDRDLVVLPGIAQVGGGDHAPAVLRDALLVERLEPLASQLVDHAPRFGPVDVVPVARVTARQVVTEVGEQHPERAEHGGEARHHDRRQLSSSAIAPA
jgi:hypothetical protein